MKKLLQWGLIVAVVLFITPGKMDKVLAAGHCGKENKVQEQNKVLLLVEMGETTQQKKAMKKIVNQIREKTKGTLYELDSKDGTMRIDLEQYDLILIGGVEEKGQISGELKNFLKKTDFSKKRISPFWLEQKEDGETEEFSYETEFQELTTGAVCLPGLGFTGHLNKQEEENGRMDGWLTTAFTLGCIPVVQNM